MGLLGILLVILAAVCSFVFIHSAATFGIWILILYGTVAVYQGATGALGPRILPRSHYGQFCAASALIFHFGQMLLSPVLGFLTDHYGNVAVFPWLSAWTVTVSPSSATVDARIDTTAPSAPSLTLSESSALEYVSGSTLYYNPQGSNSASFDVAATSSDAQSGIASIAFPAVYGSDSSTVTSSPYSQTYSWDASAGASGSKTVT